MDTSFFLFHYSLQGAGAVASLGCVTPKHAACWTAVSRPRGPLVSPNFYRWFKGYPWPYNVPIAVHSFIPKQTRVSLALWLLPFLAHVWEAAGSCERTPWTDHKAGPCSIVLLFQRWWAREFWVSVLILFLSWPVGEPGSKSESVGHESPHWSCYRSWIPEPLSRISTGHTHSIVGFVLSSCTVPSTILGAKNRAGK